MMPRSVLTGSFAPIDLQNRKGTFELTAVLDAASMAYPHDRLTRASTQAHELSLHTVAVFRYG
jgi:hypothetical protein